MTQLMRPLTALLLALVLATTSVSMAVARGGMSLGGSMILCVNAGQVVVSVGPDGQPMEDMPFCPDCAMGALALTDLAPLQAPLRRATLAQATPIFLPSHVAPVQAAHARGPPLFV